MGTIENYMILKCSHTRNNINKLFFALFHTAQYYSFTLWHGCKPHHQLLYLIFYFVIFSFVDKFIDFFKDNLRSKIIMSYNKKLIRIKTLDIATFMKTIFVQVKSLHGAL